MRVFPLQSAAGDFGPRRVTELRAELRKMFQSKKHTTNQNHHHYYPRKNTTIKPASQQHTRKLYQVEQLVCPGYGKHNTDLISHMALYEIGQNYSSNREARCTEGHFRKKTLSQTHYLIIKCNKKHISRMVSICLGFNFVQKKIPLLMKLLFYSASSS